MTTIVIHRHRHIDMAELYIVMLHELILRFPCVVIQSSRNSSFIRIGNNIDILFRSGADERTLHGLRPDLYNVDCTLARTYMQGATVTNCGAEFKDVDDIYVIIANLLEEEKNMMSTNSSIHKDELRAVIRRFKEFVAQTDGAIFLSYHVDYTRDELKLTFIDCINNLPDYEACINIQMLFANDVYAHLMETNIIRNVINIFGIKRKTPVGLVPEIKNVIYNGPATIVIWADDTKTIVKAQSGEPVDYEKGLSMAIAKKALGNQGSYYEVFKKWPYHRHDIDKNN